MRKIWCFLQEIEMKQKVFKKALSERQTYENGKLQNVPVVACRLYILKTK